jgi:hypothetical protein
MARPRSLPNALHVRALLATRRSSTSATNTICKHDLEPSKPGLARAARSCGSVSRLPNPLPRIRLRPWPIGLRRATIAHVVQSPFERVVGGFTHQ